MKPSTLSELRGGGKPALAAALALIEETPDADTAIALLEAAYAAPLGFVIGLTGPPGVGKSTLASALLRHWRADGISVGVIAIDPSSQRTGGALLGDRIRMRTDPADSGVFMRSLAARRRLGGLAELAFPAVILMRAVFDRVLVESVGVGQSEADIADVADRVVLCVQPGAGDWLQFMKAGIMEIPDLAVVTKSDMGAPARRALADIKGALGLASGHGSGDGSGLASGGEIACLPVSASTGEGMEALVEALSPPTASPLGIAARRHAQAEAWLRSAIAQRFGEAGIRAAGDALALAPDQAPFAAARAVSAAMRIDYAPPP